MTEPAQTVAAAFAATARRFPDHPFLCILPETAAVYGIPAETIAYRAAADAVASRADLFRGAGYGPGHRVGLLLENRPQFFIDWLALNTLGAGVVPIAAELRSADLAYLVAHSEISLSISLAERVDDLRDAASGAGIALSVATPEAREIAPAPPRRAGVPPGLHTECALLYTSGTTGRPKGCVLSNRYFLRAGEWYGAVGGLCELRPGAERLITPLPMVHMNAMACSTMAMILAGGCIVPLDRFHPKTWWDSVRGSGATILHYLGIMPTILMAAPAGDDRNHRVRFGFGAGVERRLHGEFETRFGFPLLEAWAMTETGAGAVVIANREPRHVGMSCFGSPELAVATRIVDEQGQDLGPDENGELLVRATGDDPRDGFFTEYLKDPDATTAAWAGGWFHTGDIVRRDADGFLYFVDRKKNVIRRSGENISAVEVESVLRLHPLVREAAVAATPDAMRGDEVLAVVVLKEMPAEIELPEIAASIADHCLSRLAYYKAPGYVAFVDGLPLTATQKLNRAALKSLARDLPATPRCIDTRERKRRSSFSGASRAGSRGPAG